jgi:hypothetical protein
VCIAHYATFKVKNIFENFEILSVVVGAYGGNEQASQHPGIHEQLEGSGYRERISWVGW